MCSLCSTFLSADTNFVTPLKIAGFRILNSHKTREQVRRERYVVSITIYPGLAPDLCSMSPNTERCLSIEKVAVLSFSRTIRARPHYAK